MRAREPGNGRELPRASHRPRRPAPPLHPVAQGGHARLPDAGGRAPAARAAGPAAGAGRAAEAQDALHPPLGPQPLRRPRQRGSARGDHPRSGLRREAHAPRRGLEALHRRRPRARAHGRLPARRRAPPGAAARPHGPRLRPRDLARAGAAPRPRAPGLRPPGPLLHAVGRRRRRGVGRSRPAHRARAGIPPARRRPGGRGGAALLGRPLPRHDAQPAVARQRLLAPAPPAGGVVRAAPPGRRGVALRGRDDDPAHDHVELRGGADRRDHGRPWR